MQVHLSDNYMGLSLKYCIAFLFLDLKELSFYFCAQLETHRIFLVNHPDIYGRYKVLTRL